MLLSSTDSVVIRVPSPSTWMAPPSLARKLPMHSSSRLLRMRRANPSSRPWADLPPQALKRQLIPAVPSSG
ncbi:hypothetical protein D3C84_1034310 [compost metagenome]